MIKNKIIIKSFFILLQFIAVLYVIFHLMVGLTPKNNTSISRSCTCQSENKTLQNAFLKDGSKTDYFNCPMTIATIGRLGNNMGQYATLLALARINGFAPYQQEVLKEQLSKYFNPSMPVITKEVYKQVNWSILPLHNWMSHEYFQLDCNFTLMYGYPNSWTFFHHIRDEIKREFQFRSEIIRAAQEQLGSLKKSDNTTFIGVHVRRTDYVVLMYYLYNGVLANSEFFTQAMNYFRRKFKNCLFIVCSDDLKWCKKNIDNSLGDVHFCWNGNSTTPGRDMALLTQCNHSIITVGTFGFWSAYLTGGEVVYLNNYLRNSSILRKNFYFNATYRSEWIPIDADVNCTM